VLVLDLAVDFHQELADEHLLEHFECYLVTVLAVAFHIFVAVVDPSFLYNVHTDPFAVDLDRVDALECVALAHAVDQHEDDIVVDEGALVNDDQEYVVVEHA
jgi:predicted ribosome-associated RNA-binding protein Tma20